MYACLCEESTCLPTCVLRILFVSATRFPLVTFDCAMLLVVSHPLFHHTAQCPRWMLLPTRTKGYGLIGGKEKY